MVRGKPSNRLDRGVDILTLSLRDRFLKFMLINTTTRRDKVGPWSPVVGESDPIHKPEKKGKWLFGNDPTVFQTRGPDGVPNVCVRSAWLG